LIQRFGKEETDAVSNCIKKASYLSGFSNKYLGGPEIQKFEQEFARFHGCKYGITLNSGTSALYVALNAAGVKSKTRVAVPCITFTATTSQVIANGGIPQFADIDPYSYCMDYDFAKSLRFAIPVHLLGHPCKFEMIKKMKDSGMFVIEDCAQSMGARYRGKSVGSMGDCGIFSFQETKHITTLGEGGMIVTNNEEFAENCRRIRNHGEYYKNDKNVGHNFRMTEVQAAFGRVQFKKLPGLLRQFKSNVKFIVKNLPEEIIPPRIPDYVEHSFMILGCKFDSKKTTRDKFIDRLTKNRHKFLENESKSDIKGINFRPGKIISSGYRTVQYEIPLYRKFAPKRPCVNGEEFVRKSVFLDIHRWRSKSEIEEELDILNRTTRSLTK
jgi:perosamine synthetase